MIREDSIVRANQTVFYAVANDMSDLLAALEVAQDVQYTRTGLFAERDPVTVRSYREIPDFGIAIHPTAVANPSYMMSLRGETVDSTPIPQKAGGVLFAVDQSSNSNAIFLQPGGRYGSDVILYGTVGTMSPSQQALTLYKIVSKLLRKKFSPVNEYLVGPDAFEAWNAGARLTIAVQSPPEFNLKPWEPE